MPWCAVIKAVVTDPAVSCLGTLCGLHITSHHIEPRWEWLCVGSRLLRVPMLCLLPLDHVHLFISSACLLNFRMHMINFTDGLFGILTLRVDELRLHIEISHILAGVKFNYGSQTITPTEGQDKIPILSGNENHLLVGDISAICYELKPARCQVIMADSKTTPKTNSDHVGTGNRHSNYASSYGLTSWCYSSPPTLRA